VTDFRRIKGTQDILPDNSENWQHVEKVIQQTMRVFNYREIRTPIFEKTELFARSIGQATDIVSKEMYSFLDRGKKNITLKPEMTAPAMRAFIENNLNANSPLTKLYYISPLFRQENPQAGRLRQFHQFGAEAIGSDSAILDSESIILAMEVYKHIGIKNLQVRINSVGDPKCREPYKEKLKQYLKPLLPKYCPDCQQRYETNTLRVLDCKKEKCREMNSHAPKLVDSLCEDCETHFNIVKQLLDDQNLEYTIDPYLVRGLDYYTRTVFEITSGDLGAQDAICGGGRYDLLAEELGGKPTPAVGFASGMERLMMVMESQGLFNTDQTKVQIYISSLGENASIKAQKWVNILRNQGYIVERDYMGRSLKSQMRDANRQDAQLVLILGDNEIEQKQFSVKQMGNNVQENVGFDKIEQYIADFFNI